VGRRGPVLATHTRRLRVCCRFSQIINKLESAHLRQDRKITESVLPVESLLWQMRPTAGPFSRLWNYAFRLVGREHILSLADQVVVSGTSFLTTLLIARWSDLRELGVYAVGISLVGFALTCQDSLILEPYQIQRHYPQGTSAERAGASLALSVLFSAASILALASAALGFLKWGEGSDMALTTWSMAWVMPIALTRNFARRFSFARLEFGRALALDVATALILLSTLGWLGTSGHLSALSAWGALGGAYAVSTMGWLYHTRAAFAVRVQHVRIVLKQTWALGRWLVAAQIAAQLQGNVTYWLCMAIAGATATGVFAACMSIVAFANPLLQGIANTWMPKLVLAWTNGGGPALWRETIRNSVLIGVLLAAFSLAILIAGERILHLLYPGTEVQGANLTLTLLALSMLAGSVGWPGSIALATMERPLAIVVTAAAGTILTGALVWLLLPNWSLVGAACGWLGGSIAGTLLRWAALFFLIPKSHTSVARV
jgi:O-antigen/teichoic acid export membrane protein